MNGIVYLLHFSEPFGRPQSDEDRLERGMPPRKDGANFQVRHYIGFTLDLEKRLEEHRCGRGSRLLAAVAAAGIRWSVAAVWVGDRELERRLKDQKHGPRLCPICNEELIPFYCPPAKVGKELSHGL